LTWHVTHVANDIDSVGESPAGVALRQWGPASEVFLFHHGMRIFTGGGTPIARHAGRFTAFSCDTPGAGEDWCENVTEESREVIGATQFGAHYLHPAMGIRKINSGADRELLLSRAVYDYWGSVGCSPVGNSERWDLVSYTWDTTNGLTDTHPIEAATIPAQCTDFGVTEVKFDGSGTGRACYTNSDPSTHDTVHCNEQGTGIDWGNVEELEPINPFMDDADHPSFVMSGGAPTVVHHEGDGSEHWISFRPGASGATEFRFDDATAKNFRKDHPVIVENDDEMRVVYQFGEGTNARIMYKWCDDTSGDCDDYTADPTNTNSDDWHEEIVTDSHRDAAHAELLVDVGQQREFVAFTYDTTVNGSQWRRVVVGTRCVGQDNDWDFFEPRTPDVSTDDQALNFGRPSMVLDRAHDVVHIAFVEADEWEGNQPSYITGGSGDLYWARASYADGVLEDCN